MTADPAALPGDNGADLAAGYIARWRPSSLSPRAAAFARDVIAQVAPEEKERAKNLLPGTAAMARKPALNPAPAGNPPGVHEMSDPNVKISAGQT